MIHRIRRFRIVIFKWHDLTRSCVEAKEPGVWPDFKILQVILSCLYDFTFFWATLLDSVVQFGVICKQFGLRWNNVGKVVVHIAQSGWDQRLILEGRHSTHLHSLIDHSYHSLAMLLPFTQEILDPLQNIASNSVASSFEITRLCGTVSKAFE